MNFLRKLPILGRLIKEDKGQALVFTAVVLTAWVGVTGVAVDAGKGYYAFEMLKASTNAAALAGAAGLPNTATATTYADDYGSQTAAENANGVMTNVVTTPTFSCNSNVTSKLNVACLPSPGTTGTGNNTIVVTQTAQVPTWIGPLFGMPTFNLQATAAAAMSGGAYIPYNIAVVIDTTSSMNGSDDGANSGSACTTQISCARLGFQTLLEKLYPCQSSDTCTSSTSSVDNVALFTFPTINATGMKVGSGNSQTNIADDTVCSTTNPPIVPYTFTSTTAPWQPGGTSTYPTSFSNQAMLVGGTGSYGGYTGEVTPFENTYKAADQSAALITSDPIVVAAGAGSCNGLQAPGGEGTYYAQVIYQAQSALAYEQSLNGYKNAMIILSDGDATSCVTNLASASGTTTSNTCGNGKPSQLATTVSGGYLNGTGTKTQNPMSPSGCSASSTSACSGYLSYQYPSALGECGQAVAAAQAASAAGTTVFTIGYGTETQSSCTTDSTYSTTASGSTYGANAWGPGDQACAAMGAMATNAQDFYSDDVNGCAATAVSHQNLTSLAQIFTSLAQTLSTSRLVPTSWI